MEQRNKNFQAYKQKEEKKNNVTRNTLIIIGLIIVLIIGAVAVSSMAETNSYLKEVRVCDATVSEKTTDGGKYYLRLTLKSNKPTDYISADALWIEVTTEFYGKAGLNTDVGVLLGKYDELKKGKFSNKLKLAKSDWGINNIYYSLEEAKEANPQSNYTEKAKISKKRTAKSGETYFVLIKDDRSYITKVDKGLYDKLEVNSEVDCEFESIGEFIKLIKVIG